jgi:hypothetical protein
MADEMITPRTATAEVAPKDGVTAAPATSDDLPDELIQLPAIQAVFAGEPPALSASIQDFAERPEAKLIAANKDKLMGSGLALYRSLSGDVGVLFNQFYISPEDIKSADSAGRLQEIAPPFDAVSEMVGKSGANNPVLKDKARPKGFATASTQMPPQSGAMPGAATPAQNKIVQERAKSLAPGKPTDRGAAGKLLSSIMKPVV